MTAMAQAEAYASADFEAPNSAFVGHVEAFLEDAPITGMTLDLGCGPADICVRLAHRHPAAGFDALDGSAAMLSCARERLRLEPEPVAVRIRLLEDRLPSSRLRRCHYDLVISNSLLHHLHDPGVLWQSIRASARPGARVVVMDLRRPESTAVAAGLVDRYAVGEPEILRQDFYNSLLAAFTPEEVRQQLTAAGLDSFAVSAIGDRHLLVTGSIPA
jgi:SAM-dependent methyltransferase